MSIVSATSPKITGAHGVAAPQPMGSPEPEFLCSSLSLSLSHGAAASKDHVQSRPTCRAERARKNAAAHNHGSHQSQWGREVQLGRRAPWGSRDPTKQIMVSRETGETKLNECFGSKPGRARNTWWHRLDMPLACCDSLEHNVFARPRVSLHIGATMLFGPSVWDHGKYTDNMSDQPRRLSGGPSYITPGRTSSKPVRRISGIARAPHA